MDQYFVIFVVILICLFVGSVIYFIPTFGIRKYEDSEKLSPYECGFDPFIDTKDPFDVKYYLVSILFIIFDLEVSFLFPWAIVFPYLGAVGFISMFVFFVILTLGFAYEWENGALDW